MGVRFSPWVLNKKDMKLQNIILVIKDQLPINRFIRNLVKGRFFGLINKRSHYREDGSEKVSYSKKSVLKAKERMIQRKGYYFSAYKCLYCDGYHLGADRYKMNKENS